VSFQSRIHLNHCGRSCCALWLTKVLLSEQELSVEVGNLNVVRVSHHNASSLFSGSQLKHREIFEQLTSNGSGTDHEDLRIFKFLEELSANDGPKACCPVLHRQSGLDKLIPALLLLGRRLNDFREFCKEVLVDGSVLACDGLESLLSSQSSIESTERTKSARTGITE
jgi:hypothetical protein